MKNISIIVMILSLSLSTIAQDPIEGATCEMASITGFEIGDSVAITCEPDCVEGSVWGTGIYTDDINLCTAAAHTGVITLDEGGTFVVTVADGRESYFSSNQNDIVSNSWGSWDTSLTFSSIPTSITWDMSATAFESEKGTYFPVHCESNGTINTVWGTEVYTDDSSLCTAALHMGIITLDNGGDFYVSIVDGQESYAGTSSNDVETLDYGEWSRSFVVSAPVMEIEWSTQSSVLTGPLGSSYRVMCPENGEVTSVWGTDFYTDDASICSAAVHAGFASPEAGGLFIVTIESGLESYSGSDRNGVTSMDWGAWERSFSIRLWK